MSEKQTEIEFRWPQLVKGQGYCLMFKQQGPGQDKSKTNFIINFIVPIS